MDSGRKKENADSLLKRRQLHRNCQVFHLVHQIIVLFPCDAPVAGLPVHEHAFFILSRFHSSG